MELIDAPGLNVGPNGAPPHLSNLGKLPPSLKSLHINAHNFDLLGAAEIKSLPKTLRTIQLKSFDLQHAQVFASHLQDCHLFIETPKTPWDIPESVRLNTGHWLPHLDMHELHIALQIYYGRLRVHFSLQYPKEFLLNPQLRSIPPHHLEAITFPSTDVIAQLSKLPRSLQRITIERSPAELNFWHFNCLTHLNTPLMRIDSRFWHHLRDLTLLKATIVGLEDFNVVPFLTTLLSRKTRINASITICTYITGALLHDNEVDGLEDATWELIQQKSESLLKSQLASPMPPSTSEDTTHAIENDTIGRIVTSLQFELHSLASNCRPIILPSSATSISLRVDCLNWDLGPNWMVTPSMSKNGLRPPIISDNYAPLPNRLVHLELYKWRYRGRMPVAFPESLRYLLIQTYDSIEDESTILMSSWPSKLEVLLIWPWSRRRRIFLGNLLLVTTLGDWSHLRQKTFPRFQNPLSEDSTRLLQPFSPLLWYVGRSTRTMCPYI